MSLIKHFLHLISVYFLCLHLTAQNNNINKEQLLISNTLKSLFDGMRAGDCTTVQIAFHNNIIMYTSYKNTKGQEMLAEGNLSKFLKQ